jgi:hypothetical protein
VAFFSNNLFFSLGQAVSESNEQRPFFPLKPSCLLTLNGSQLGGFLISPEMSNFNSHPGIAGGLPMGNYLEIRDAAGLDFIARVWTGQPFPLGFHGNFSSGSFVSPGN